MKKISVLLVDDHTVVRQGLGALLGDQQDLEVIAEAADGRQAVALARKHKPKVVLMDLALPVLNGVDATRAILAQNPQIKIIALTSYGDEEYVQQTIQAGASGFLMKQTAADDLLTAIREVYRGKTFFSPAIARRLRDQTRDAVHERSRALTLREEQVLQLVSEGMPNKRIASELGISIKTVEKHRQQVMNKLGIHDTAGLTRYTIARQGQHQLTVPPYTEANRRRGHDPSAVTAG
jgi:DNA-binding NarL/FixJ family response regulator